MTWIIFIIGLLTIVLVSLFISKPKEKVNKYDIKMYNILLENVVKPWDKVSFSHREEKTKYQEEKFNKLLDNNVSELNYYEFKEENNETFKAVCNFSGFSLTYYESKSKYYLSLHLGTNNDLRLAIYKSLNEKFDNVLANDGKFVQGFDFTDKKD